MFSNVIVKIYFTCARNRQYRSTMFSMTAVMPFSVDFTQSLLRTTTAETRDEIITDTRTTQRTGNRQYGPANNITVGFCTIDWTLTYLGRTTEIRNNTVCYCLCVTLFFFFFNNVTSSLKRQLNVVTGKGPHYVNDPDLEINKGNYYTN